MVSFFKKTQRDWVQLTIVHLFSDAALTGEHSQLEKQVWYVSIIKWAHNHKVVIKYGEVGGHISLPGRFESTEFCMLQLFIIYYNMNDIINV